MLDDLFIRKTTSDHPGRNSSQNRIGRKIAGYNRSGSHYRTAGDRNSFQNSNIATDPHIFADLHIEVVFRKFVGRRKPVDRPADLIEAMIPADDRYVRPDRRIAADPDPAQMRQHEGARTDIDTVAERDALVTEMRGGGKENRISAARSEKRPHDNPPQRLIGVQSFPGRAVIFIIRNGSVDRSHIRKHAADQP